MLKEVATQEQAKLESDCRKVSATDVKISDAVALAAEGAKRRKLSTKGPPSQKMMTTAPTPSAATARRVAPEETTPDDDIGHLLRSPSSQVEGWMRHRGGVKGRMSQGQGG
eukprot:3175845-Pyramimonas_sp.AAC.1